MNMIVTLLLYLIVLGLIYYCVSLLPLPAPFGVIIQVVFVVAAILVLLSALGILDGGFGRLRL